MQVVARPAIPQRGLHALQPPAARGTNEAAVPVIHPAPTPQEGHGLHPVPPSIAAPSAPSQTGAMHIMPELVAQDASIGLDGAWEENLHELLNGMPDIDMIEMPDNYGIDEEAGKITAGSSPRGAGLNASLCMFIAVYPPYQYLLPFLRALVCATAEKKSFTQLWDGIDTSDHLNVLGALKDVPPHRLPIVLQQHGDCHGSSPLHHAALRARYVCTTVPTCALQVLLKGYKDS